MTSTRCHYLLCGCFIVITIEWDIYANFINAREELAKRLGAQFMFED